MISNKKNSSTSSKLVIFIQLLRESVVFAAQSLKTNKLRSFLSLLSVAIGIFLIISVLTVVDSLENNIRDSVKSLGQNIVYIQKWPWIFGNNYPWWKYINRPLPGYREMGELEKRTQTVKSLAYVAFINAKLVKYKNNSAENVSVAAISERYMDIRKFEIEKGRFFSDEEFASGKPFAVIGANLAEALFPNTDPLGANIDVMGSKLQVLGVMAKEGKSMLDNSMDDVILVPVNNARNIVNLRSDRIDPFIMAEAKSFVSLAEMKEDLKEAMRAIRKLRPKEDDNFALNESTLLSQGLNSLFGIMGAGGWIIGGFSLLVGGFGIANIMFVTVKERTSIIGIQKSLGAKNYFILLQFLAEAVILCLIGAIIGLLLVYPLSVIFTNILEFNFILSRSNIILGLSVSAIIGIISGLIPALIASRMNPVEAIRAN